ncbi:hypothetical protein [Candidatus Mycoplasma haematohominis]|uniref:hypothetical protein n=1 Tax=Candidatus Mycoplasma haematohominis TaxID=1494318 RepID=UPI001C0A6F82|nr:hypothetical protein [Candidatus Mycoplasma haemohominis]
MKHKSLLFSTWFSTLGVPTLVAGSVGGGIKLYLRHFSSDLNTLPFLELVSDDATLSRTFLDEIKGRNLIPIDDSSSANHIQTVLLHHLDSRANPLTHKKDDLFTGSREVNISNAKTIEGTFTTVTDRQEKFVIHTLQKPSIYSHRSACKEALEKSYEASRDKEQLDKLVKWCTVIATNKDLLTRNGFTPLNTEDATDDDHWKTVISGGWFTKHQEKTNFKYWEKQSFFSTDELKTLLGTELDQEIKDKAKVDDSHIDLFKKKCEAVLKQEPSINNFPLSTLFREGIDQSKKSDYAVDSFYEATFFCVKPMKAEDYVRDILKAKTRSTSEDSKGTGSRICSLESSTSYSWYTYQPAEGKGFWCGVRELYAGSTRAK